MAKRAARPPVDEFESAVEKTLLDLQPRMERILWHYRIPVQDAEDLVQEVLVSFVRRFDSIRKPEAWLTSALKYQCFLFWRKRRRQICESVDEGLLEILAREKLPLVDRRDRALDLERYLKRIPSRCREILRLRYGLGLTPKELARKLGYKRSSVSNTVRRCVAALAAKLLAADTQCRGSVND